MRDESGANNSLLEYYAIYDKYGSKGMEWVS